MHPVQQLAASLVLYKIICFTHKGNWNKKRSKKLLCVARRSLIANPVIYNASRGCLVMGSCSYQAFHDTIQSNVTWYFIPVKLSGSCLIMMHCYCLHVNKHHFYLLALIRIFGIIVNLKMFQFYWFLYTGCHMTSFYTIFCTSLLILNNWLSSDLIWHNLIWWHHSTGHVWNYSTCPWVLV